MTLDNILEEIKKAEDTVNAWINEGLDVICTQMNKEDAIKSGAECMFIERYPDVVTVYTIGDVSKELCGGPHVKNTKELGHFKIIKEEAIIVFHESHLYIPNKVST